jgi:hypothetical protein
VDRCYYPEEENCIMTDPQTQTDLDPEHIGEGPFVAFQPRNTKKDE